MNKLQWNLNRNLYISIHENALKMWSAILSRPQCVKSMNTFCMFGMQLLHHFPVWGTECVVCFVLLLNVYIHWSDKNIYFRYLIYSYQWVCNYTPLRGVSAFKTSLKVLNWTCCHGIPLYRSYIQDILEGCFRLYDRLFLVFGNVD